MLISRSIKVRIRIKIKPTLEQIKQIKTFDVFNIFTYSNYLKRFKRLKLVSGIYNTKLKIPPVWKLKMGLNNYVQQHNY